MNWFRILVWTLAPLAAAALTAKGARALKSKAPEENARIGGAIASGDIARMVAAARVPASGKDRHRLLAAITAKTYKNRKDDESRALFLRFAKIHVEEYDSFHNALGDAAPAMQTHKLLAIVLEEDGSYEEAVRVCRRALDLGMSDGTKTGFAGRIDRLKKKAARR